MFSDDDFFLTDTEFVGDKPIVEEEKEKKVSFFDLFNDIPAVTGSFLAPGIRHDAVRAELVAAVHDVDPGLMRHETGDWHILDDLAHLGEDFDFPLSGRDNFIKQFRK